MNNGMKLHIQITGMRSGLVSLMKTANNSVTFNHFAMHRQALASEKVILLLH